jgi:ribosomal protein S6
MASGINPAGNTTTLNFTIDPVTPVAPEVTADDATNKIVGASATMEYSLDNGESYVSYDINNQPTFTGEKTVLVRVMASGINPAGETTTVSFHNATPVASVITLTGNAKLGYTITASYSYSDSDNDEQGSSVIKWYRADDAAGKNKILIAGANSLAYKLTKTDQGKYIIFEVTPKALTGEIIGTVVAKSMKVAPNVKPAVTKITLSGGTSVGSKITATYVYQDADNDLQGASIIKWYSADNASGKNKKLISGAKGITYTLTQNDQGKYIIFEVTPISKTGDITGYAQSSSTSAVQMMAHIKLGVVGNLNYANLLANFIKNNSIGTTVTVKKEGKYYRVYADFVDKYSSEKTMKAMKQKNYASNYSYIK